MPKKSKHKPSRKVSTQLSRNSITAGTSGYNTVPGQGSDTDDNNGSPKSSNQSLNSSSHACTRRRKSKDDDDDDDDALQRKSSPVLAPLPKLNEDEFKFFRAVESGNLDDAGEMLASGSVDDINKQNRMGYTVLHIAVRRQDEPMVKLLIAQEGILLYDTILHAIREENVEITKLLIELYDRLEDEQNQNAQPVTCARSIKNVQEANSAIISSIKRKGPPQPATTAASTRPSSTKSKVATSSVQMNAEALFDSEFHSVITPLMLAAQVGCTPLMELFYERGERLENAVYTHNTDCMCDICTKLEGDEDMTRAHQRCHLFKAITTPEYICFIARKEKKDPINYALDKIKRLRILCDRDTIYDQQYEEPIKTLEEFITKMLELCRTTNEIEIFMSPKPTYADKILPHLYPRLWHAVGLDLKEFVANQHCQTLMHKIWTSPIPGEGASPANRFMIHVVFYLVFLTCVTLEVLVKYRRCRSGYFAAFKIDDDHCKERGPPYLGLEIPIILYVLGFTASMIKKCSGVHWYRRMKWNWYEFFMVLCFFVTFAAWGSALIWKLNPQHEDLIFATERLMWPHNCAEIVGDCFIAISCMFAYGRILRFVQIFPRIGPIQIALGRQIVDFLSTAMIFIVFLMAAASGLLALYVPYKDFKGINKYNQRKTQDETFTETSSTVESLFWHLYGHGDKAGTCELLKWDVGGSSENGTLVLNHHGVTQYAGTVIYFFYHFSASMMMFSMLSGYYSNTMSHVMENADVYWKYNRTELYLTFSKDLACPPPFNLLECFLACCKRKGNEPKKENWRTLMKGYRALIVELMFRYKNFKDDENDEKKATRDDIAEIEEELDEILAFLKKTSSKKDLGGNDSSDGPPPPSTGGVAPTKAQENWDVVRSKLGHMGPSYLSNAASKGQVTQGQNRQQSTTTQPKSKIKPTAPSNVKISTVANLMTSDNNNNIVVNMAQTEGDAPIYYNMPEMSKRLSVGVKDFTGVNVRPTEGVEVIRSETALLSKATLDSKTPKSAPVMPPPLSESGDSEGVVVSPGGQGSKRLKQGSWDWAN